MKRRDALSSAKIDIKMLVFAGNPGNQYKETRHNAGWLCLETLEQRHSLSWSEKFNSRLGNFRLESSQYRVLQPLCFMNKTGEPVRKAADFFQLDPEEVLVIHDDLELPFGTVQIRKGGGLGGHNGLRSMKQHLGSDAFYRLRFGISRPSRGDVSSWVLSRFSVEEMPMMGILTERSIRVLEEILKGNHNTLINKKLNLLDGMPE
ncbi:aminoacyl-tRNA hydrolase [Oceanispirochaeta sp. M2]|nr:aminoacyl-tRNA hydrolase [Oceanispirochaeta sp. M2]NPD73205.1 aminoacyl-tRNA hydrolase [Oceanispirochaeta sp. M1]RDG31073.1 aminoacyl-tRNA hydrolase [Oceanispirochaeta sp. M1]